MNYQIKYPTFHYKYTQLCLKFLRTLLEFVKHHKPIKEVIEGSINGLRKEHKLLYLWCLLSIPSPIPSYSNSSSDLILFWHVMVLLFWGSCGKCWNTNELGTFCYTCSVNIHSPVVVIHGKFRYVLWHVTMGSAPADAPYSLGGELTMGCCSFYCVVACYGAIPVYIYW